MNIKSPIKDHGWRKGAAVLPPYGSTSVLHIQLDCAIKW
jgi:hypothetical protein